MQGDVSANLSRADTGPYLIWVGVMKWLEYVGLLRYNKKVKTRLDGSISRIFLNCALPSSPESAIE